MSNTFSIEWRVGNISLSKDFGTRRNIKKPVLFPRYKGSVDTFDAVSAYVGSQEVDPPSNLRIIRWEDSVPENSRTSFYGDVVWTGNTGYTSARYFLLTDVIGDYVSRNIEPFYWKHVIPNASAEPDSVAILNMDLTEVDSNSYKTVRIQARDSSDVPISGSYESCSIFSNYVNFYNEDTGELKIYFVRYEVGDATHYQILNPEPAFSEAELDDVSLITGRLKPWRKVYIVTQGAAFFTVTTPDKTTEYYLTPLEKSRITTRSPADISDERPWFLTVSNGSFSILRNDVSYVYSIPEFESQTFSPLSPYKVEVEEQAQYLRSDILKVNRVPMQIDSSLYKMQILIRNAQNEVLYALTTKTSRGGDYYEENGERVYRTIETDNAWVTWDSAGIAGWDAEGGFVHLQKEYPDTYYFYVTYYYEETGYELTSLNVNPIFDEEYDEQFYVLYTVPVGGDNDNVSQSASVQYIKVDRSGRVIEASQDGSGGNLDIATYINVGDQYMYYSLNASTVSPADNSAGQNNVFVTDASGFPDSGILVWQNLSGGTEYQAYDRISGDVIYFESYTLTETLPTGTTFRLHSFKTPYTALYTNNYRWLILAECHVGSTSSVEDLSIIDLRVSGGVIKDKYKDDAIVKDPRAVLARPETIVSRGQPIPGDSASIIKVPYTLLKEYGGDFTRDQVEAIISERHLATGVIPVVIFHGAIPKIQTLTSTTSSITVCWYSEGSDYSYNIYRSASKNGPWTLVNSTPYGDQVYGNCYTISGLTSGVAYYISISAVDENSVEGPKGTPWGIRVRIS